MLKTASELVKTRPIQNRDFGAQTPIALLFAQWATAYKAANEGECGNVDKIAAQLNEIEGRIAIEPSRNLSDLSMKIVATTNDCGFDFNDAHGPTQQVWAEVRQFVRMGGSGTPIDNTSEAV